MKIQVVAVGKLKERFWKEACDEYLKRLKRLCEGARRRGARLRSGESRRGRGRARTKEGRSILEKLPEHSHVILLDVGGRQLSSEGIAARVDALALSGVSEISFIVGGSGGVSQGVHDAADESMSFGKSRFPIIWHAWCCSSKSIGHSKSRVASRIINNWLRRSAERRNCSTLRRVYAASWLSGFALRSAATRQLAFKPICSPKTLAR